MLKHDERHPVHQYDKKFMAHALELAKRVKKGNGQLAVGAVVVWNGEIIGEGKSKDMHTHQVTDHAEIIAINQACKYRKSTHLEDCILYTTAEPCNMCMGVILKAKILEVVFGAHRKDLPMNGSKISIYTLAEGATYEIEIVGGVLEKKVLALFRKRGQLAPFKPIPAPV